MDGSERAHDNGKGNEGLGDYILEEMEDYMEDIVGRLTISRMVSDSVIRGMVNAIEQEAAERIAQKELELIGLKEKLHIYHVGADETKTSGSLVAFHEPHKTITYHFSDSVVEHDSLIASVESFQVAVSDQLKQLKKEIDKLIGANSIRRISSASELVGVGGILQEKKVPERWIFVDKTFESLKGTLDVFCKRMVIMARSSKASLSEWQQEQEFKSKIEGMVICNCIQSLQEEFELKVWDQNAHMYDSECGHWFDKLREISSLRQELDSISKSLSVSETGHLISHGSLENGEEWCNNKRSDHFPWKLSSNHLLPLTLEGNCKHEDSKVNPENLDPVPLKLKHMTREELATYYNSEITKMRRNHESQVQEMTEENFRLRREQLRERSSLLPLRKDKDFDMLRKKMPDVISKLDKILEGNVKVHPFCENMESISSFTDRLESLHSENCRLRDMLMDKEKEFKSISLQFSDAVENLSQQQMIEKNLLQNIQKLEGDIGDAHAEVSVIQEVYKCLLEDIGCIAEESHLKDSLVEEMYEIIFKEAAGNAQPSSRLEIEDVEIESIIMQGLLHVTFKEALLGYKAALKLEATEKEKLKQEMFMLSSIVEEKERLAWEATDALVQEKKKMELASLELNSLRDKTVQQQKLISERDKVLDVIRGDLVEALKEVELYREQMHKSHQNLEQRENELREIDEERSVLRAVIQEKQAALTVIEAKERVTRKQMESAVALVCKLLTAVADFESRINKDISKTSLRLENMSFELHCLNNRANKLKTMGLAYKQRLETRCSDLTKAEVEVDLLGDEVDTLLSLLEKIYIALDHYSPILQHYPGITEVLELIRRELTGESRKLV